jgi:hypothetical protein
MGFFKKKRKDVTVSIGSVTREYVEEPSYRELDQNIYLIGLAKAGRLRKVR